MTFRVLIVDDEPPARRRLRRLVESLDAVDRVEEAVDGIEAVRAVARDRPDILFLDVQMPGRDGFEVLAALDAPLPAVIFVTAFDRYCLKAFEAQAMDYLLKPFTDQRFRDCFERAAALLRQQRIAAHHRALEALLEQWPGTPAALDRLAIRSGETVEFLPVATIDWIQVDGNYLTLYAGDRTALLRRSLSSLATELPPEFVRIHRSIIVNTRRIRRLHPLFHGEYIVELESGRELRSSRTFAAELNNALRL